MRNDWQREGYGLLSQAVTDLLDMWRVPLTERPELLGLPGPDAFQLAAGADNGLAERCQWLLAIDADLRLLYPGEAGLALRWPHLANADFGMRAPLAVMREEGEAGIRQVLRYLDFLLIEHA